MVRVQRQDGSYVTYPNAHHVDVDSAGHLHVTDADRVPIALFRPDAWESAELGSDVTGRIEPDREPVAHGEDDEESGPPNVY